MSQMDMVANMQDVTPQDQHRAAPVSITAEGVVYAALVLIALALRLAQLGSVPLSNGEAAHALSAWRSIHPELLGVGMAAVNPSSPLLHMVQSLSLALLGGSEFAARIMTVLGSLALILSPLLFRAKLGRGRTFMLSLLLAFSPVLFAASRSSAPAVWSSLLVVIGLWALYRFVDLIRGSDNQRSLEISLAARARYGVAAIACLLSAALLADFAGLLVLFMVTAAGFLAVTLTGEKGLLAIYTFEDERELPSSPASRPIAFGTVITALPWLSGAAVTVLAIVVVSTGFLSHPAGLSGTAELLARFLGGFSATAPAPVYPLLLSLFYEPFLWAFAAVAVIRSLVRGPMSGINRFMLAWVAVAVVIAFLYPGAAAEHALWFILPLAVLASDTLVSLFASESMATWYVPTWGRWLVALATLAIFAVLTIAFQDVSRTLLNSPDGWFLDLHFDPSRVILLIIPLLFLLITFFLVASVWSDRTAFQGFGLGILIFSLITSFGAGWRIAVENSSLPNEWWHMEAVSDDVGLLRETLQEVAERQSGGFNEVEVGVVAPDDGIIAWELRDFSAVHYVADAQEAVGMPVILMMESEVGAPDRVVNNYVGQDFLISRTWSPENLLPTEIPAWWSQRRTRINDTGRQRVILWLRGDVYQGTDFNTEDGIGVG
ncbi:MAG: hypothetical protein U0670_06300 [Anaerolineae bacterium]